MRELAAGPAGIGQETDDVKEPAGVCQAGRV